MKGKGINIADEWLEILRENDPLRARSRYIRLWNAYRTQETVRYEARYVGGHIGEWQDCGPTVCKELMMDTRYEIRRLVVRPEAL